MVLARMNRRLILTTFCIIWLSAIAAFANEIEFTKTFQSNNILLTFNLPIRLNKLIIPPQNQSIWQTGQSCICAVAIIDNIKRISSIGASNTELIFDFGKSDIKQILIKPLVFSKKPIKSDYSDLAIEGISTQKATLQDNLDSYAQKIIDFQKNNKCFSCHAMIPFAAACEEADFKGLEIPKEKISVLLEQISSFQQADGSYEFRSDPEYGKITTTLSAAFIASTLGKFATQPNPVIQKIFKQLPLWQNKDGSLKNDFTYLPIFSRHVTSSFLEAKFISNILYNNSVNQNEMFLYDRLGWLQSWARKNVNLESPSNLLFFLGIPYFLQLTQEEKSEIYPKLLELKKSKAYEKLPEIKIITNFLLNKYFNYKITNNDSVNWKSQPDSKTYWKLLEESLFIK